MFTLQKIDIDVSGEYIAILNKRDAEKLEVHSGERLEIYPSNAPKRSLVCVLNVLEKNTEDSLDGEVDLEQGELGLYIKAFETLGLKEGETVDARPLPRPESFEYAKDKLEKGTKLTDESALAIIRDIVDNKYPQSLITYFLIACAAKDLDDDETASLTKALVQTGQTLHFAEPIVADKHCIGGIPGNRTTPIIVAIVAAAGIPIPNTFTRSITSPAGTADTLETYMKVDLSLSQMEKMVKKFKGCLVWGGAIDMAPADDIIIRVEHPLNIDSESQMIASILAKKVAAGNTHCLLDIPMGPAAKVKTREHAEHLKTRFETISAKLGLKLKVLITDGSEPIGHGIGPVLEMLDVLNVLKNDSEAPIDLREKSLFLTGELFDFIGKTPAGSGYKLAEQILESGEALRKMEEIRKYQGENEVPNLSETYYDFMAAENGMVKAIDNKVIVKLAKMAGAPMDVQAGVYIFKHNKMRVKAGDPLFRIYSNNKTRLEYAKEYLLKNTQCYVIEKEAGVPARRKVKVVA